MFNIHILLVHNSDCESEEETTCSSQNQNQNQNIENHNENANREEENDIDSDNEYLTDSRSSPPYRLPPPQDLVSSETPNPVTRRLAISSLCNSQDEDSILRPHTVSGLIGDDINDVQKKSWAKDSTCK